jgi:hydroxyethylthiazole kinase
LEPGALCEQNLDVFALLSRVRTARPLVHHLTNWVTIYDCANVVKVLGASPVMAHAPEEVADMVGLASALVLNIGTLTVQMVEAMKKAARGANDRGIPVVLDVCGAGATPFRDQKSLELLTEVRIDIIKGNASEVARVSGAAVRTRGVDAAEVAQDLKEVARSLARSRRATVVITGETDIVADAEQAVSGTKRPSPHVPGGGHRLHGRQPHRDLRGGVPRRSGPGRGRGPGGLWGGRRGRRALIPGAGHLQRKVV